MNGMSTPVTVEITIKTMQNLGAVLEEIEGVRRKHPDIKVIIRVQ